MNYLGILGAAFLVIAWLPLTIKTLINKRSEEDVLFGMLFLVGAALLMVYSIQINDLIFAVLNCLAMVFAFINVEYIPRKSEKFYHEIDEILGIKGKKYYHIKHKNRRK